MSSVSIKVRLVNLLTPKHAGSLGIFPEEVFQVVEYNLLSHQVEASTVSVYNLSLLVILTGKETYTIRTAL